MTKNCSTDAATLSAYYDHELPDDQRAVVEKHIATCQACQDQLRRLRALSTMAEHLPDFIPKKTLFGSVVSRLNSQSNPLRRPTLRRRWILITTVSSLVVVLLTILLLTDWLGHSHIGHRIVDFSPYLNRFPASPELAVEYFVANYDGKPILMPDAEKVEGYSSAVSTSLESEYARRQLFLLDMPCCRCVCGTYQHSDGHFIHVFQHAREQAVSFGNHHVIVSNCHGRNCRLVQVDGLLAVNWPTVDNRSITVVGAKRIEEAAHLVEIVEH